MRINAPVILIAVITPLLCHCGGGSSISSSGASNPGYGPFDRHGNYVEEWADKPAKKHWWARKAKPAPVKEEPKIASTSESESRTSTSSSRGTEVASVSRSTTSRSTSSRSTQATTTRTTSPPPVAYNPPPKPKPVTVKPAAPPPRRHTVVKGDTLYNLSRRYGTSISSIQRANGISGTTIRLGQRLLIPR